MLDVFASVGVQHFDLTHTNIDGEKRGFRPKQSLAQVRNSMPHLLESAKRRQNNVILRPHPPPEVLLVQLDDLNADKIERVREISFLMLRTSPGNYQAWVAVQNPQGSADSDFSRRLRKGAGADPTASGATRSTGTRNFKRKYEPDFPTVEIEAAKLGHIVARETLNALGLVAEPEPVKAPVNALPPTRRARGRWPSYQYCLDRAPRAQGEERPDVSRADFTWCMTAIDWGWPVEDTARRLMEESAKAGEEGERYAIETAKNAALAVERRRGYLSEMGRS